VDRDLHRFDHFAGEGEETSLQGDHRAFLCGAGEGEGVVVGKSAGNCMDAAGLQGAQNVRVFRADDGNGGSGKVGQYRFPAGVLKQKDGIVRFYGMHRCCRMENPVGRMGEEACQQSAEIRVWMFADDLDGNDEKRLFSGDDPRGKEKGCTEVHP